jgi:hypothetical protein
MANFFNFMFFLNPRIYLCPSLYYVRTPRLFHHAAKYRPPLVDTGPSSDSLLVEWMRFGPQASQGWARQVREVKTKEMTSVDSGDWPFDSASNVCTRLESHGQHQASRHVAQVV